MLFLQRVRESHLPAFTGRRNWQELVRVIRLTAVQLPKSDPVGGQLPNSGAVGRQPAPSGTEYSLCEPRTSNVKFSGAECRSAVLRAPPGASSRLQVYGT